MHYSEAIKDLLAGDRLMPLNTGMHNEAVLPRLEQLSVQAFAPNEVKDDAAARCCLAGLWLLHDFLDDSHRISQDIGTIEGSYWHGIMHRRELDYGNSKYWFRRVGRHPIFESLRAEAAKIDQAPDFIARHKTWDPFAFVDLCEQAARDTATLDAICRRIQQTEWRLLFDYCYLKALQ